MKKAFLILGLVAVSAAAGGLTAWTVSADRGGSVAYIEREVERTPALGTQFTSYQAEQYPDLTYAAENAVKAVVNIEAIQQVEMPQRRGYDPFLEFFGIPQDYGRGDGRPQYREQRAGGSGVIISEDGYIVTNAHVVLNTSESIVTVKLHDGTEYPAIVIGYEEDSDLAVLRVEAQGLQPAEFGDASELKVGEEVFAIGNPGGDRYGGTLTGGYVSGLNRELEKSAANGLTYIQTDAAINPGNSGGALFNAYGQVVGINSNKVVSTSYEGIGFAIPISEVSNIIGDLMTKGYVSGRGRLGITARTVTELQAEASGIPTGVLIVSVDDDSPLKGIAFAGDIITEAAGEKISSLEDLYAVLRTHGGGESITVTIYSAGTADTKSSEEQYTIVLLEDRGETQAG